MTFPEVMDIKFDPGRLDRPFENTSQSFVQRCEDFNMIPIASNAFRLIWPLLPPEDFIHEVHITVKSDSGYQGTIKCAVCSENMTWRKKEFLVEIN